MLELKHIHKRYNCQKVLDDISLIFPDVGMIGIIGPSGCGKSTLLNIIGGIDKDFSGDLLYNGQSVKKHLTRYRQIHVSFIFQQLHLIHWLSVFNNIQLSQYFHKQNDQNVKMDISQFKNLKISSLSFGQRQKVSYLRACYYNKDILLCDEPTGSLDSQNAQTLMELLKQESKYKLVIIVSHNFDLIKEFCDEIHEIKDGRLINHIKQSQQLFPYINQTYQQTKKIFPFLSLAWFSLLANKKRTFQMIMGFSLSLLCVLITLTMGQSLEIKINDYIYSLIPPSSISVQSVQQSFDDTFIKEVEKLDGVNRIQLFLDDYEQLGIGFVKERYQESQTLFISDDTAPYEHLPLKYGHFPTQKNEILVSQSTAQHLCSKSNFKELLGKKVYAWYKHKNEVNSISYYVVGITQNMTTVDTIYQQPNAYIDLLQKEKIMKDMKSHTGIIFVEQDRDRSIVLKQLMRKYPQYKFIETGTSTIKQVSSMMIKIKIVLWIFSSLAMLSSLFLIGEVMFFNVFQKKKDFAIMQCFGARLFDFIRMILCESLIIVGVSLGLVFLTYIQIIHIFNSILKAIAIYESIVLSVDISLFFVITFLSFVLVCISQIAPVIYITRLNTVNALKD